MPIATTRVFRNLPNGLQIPDGPLVILTGSNNSGKSSVLQYLNIYSDLRARADYVSPRRFDMSNEIAIALNADEELRQLWNNRKNYNDQTAELSAPDPIRELIGMTDVARQKVIDWHNTYFGQLEIERKSTTNRFSAPQITIDGRLVTQQGSGSRAVLGVLCALLHPDRDVVLIDEPEIGIEPQVQKRLATLIRKVAAGEDELAKKTVYVATHSHLFLDRLTLGNNYVVGKNSLGDATIRQVTTPEEFHALVFHLLGNSPEDLFFPDNILVVEGPSDQVYWRRLLELSNCGGIAVHFSDGDDRVSAAVPGIDQMLKTLAYVPWYRDRMCISVDSSVNAQLLADWRAFLGDDGTRVRQLAQNGIEYFYPRGVLSRMTGIALNELEAALDAYLTEMKKAKRASMGGFTGSKRDFANRVALEMSVADLNDVPKEVSSLLAVVRDNRFSVRPA